MSEPVKKPIQKTFSNQGLTFCRADRKCQPKPSKVTQLEGGSHCPKCLFRVRGAGHDQGSHHLSKVKK